MKMKKGLDLLRQDIKDNAPGLAVVAGYILFFQFFFHTICPMQLIFGLPCPGCGLTRAFLLAIRGQFTEAFSMHPFLYALVFLALYWAICRYIVQKRSKVLRALAVIVLIGMILFYIYRMYMYYPETEPMNPLMNGWVKQVISIMKGE